MGSKKVFVSYSSKQGEWVLDRLVPCLKAGGAEVLVDRERFVAGKSLVGQMDATQDKAERHVLVLSEDYLASKYCHHEMDRAVALDPDFSKGIVIPVVRVKCKLPTKISKHPPLYVDLCDDKDAAQWKKLLDACETNLRSEAPQWLGARDEIRRYLRRNESVNLVVHGKVKWEELIDSLSSDVDPLGPIGELPAVDLESGATVSRRGLVAEIVRALGGKIAIPPEPEDLVVLDRFIGERTLSRLILKRFDWVAHRSQYGTDLFGTLRNLVTEQRKLVLLIQSRTPIQSLLPANHPLSSGFYVQTVELKERR
jgi:hypothetical protein